MVDICVAVCTVGEWKKKVKSGGIGENIYNRVITGLSGPKTVRSDTGKFPAVCG